MKGDNLYFSGVKNWRHIIVKVHPLIQPTALHYIPQKFNHLRGIGCWGDHFFVLDSDDHQVLKYDRNWHFVDKIHGDCLDGPHGMFVSEEHLFVCSSGNSRICILGHELEHDFEIPIVSPRGIVLFMGKYFVTCPADDGGKIVILYT